MARLSRGSSGQSQSLGFQAKTYVGNAGSAETDAALLARRERLQERRHFERQLAREVAERAQARGQPLARARVQAHAPRGGLLERRPARGEAADDPGEHVARAGDAEPRVAPFVTP